MAEWKKRKDIKGVSASTIVDLKSVLATTEQDTKRFKASGEKIPKANITKKTQELYSQNKGVQQRAQRDEDVDTEQDKSWDVAEAKLRAKADLYNNMVRGESLQPDDDSEEGTYLVDFEQKNWETREDEQYDHNPKMFSYDMDREDERKRWENSAHDEWKAQEQKRERMRMAEQLDSDTKKGRKKHIEMKMKRKKDLEQRLHLIKQKEMKRKLGTTEEEQEPETPAQPEMYNPEEDAEEDDYIPLEGKKPDEAQQQQSIERAINGLFRTVKHGMHQ